MEWMEALPRPDLHDRAQVNDPVRANSSPAEFTVCRAQYTDSPSAAQETSYCYRPSVAGTVRSYKGTNAPLSSNAFASRKKGREKLHGAPKRSFPGVWKMVIRGGGDAGSRVRGG